jgi:hypothetical protein
MTKLLAFLATFGSIALTIACASPSDASASDDEAEATGSAASEREEHDRWASIAERGGATVHRSGRATVIGVRSADALSRRAYDDALVVLTADRRVVKLDVSTHPWERDGVNGVPDVDGDRVKDVGMIRPGVYVAVGRGDRRIAGEAAFDVRTAAGTDRLPGIRDTNHDGLFDEREDAASLARGDGLTAVLFHTADGDAPPAVGCQVLAAPAMRELTRAVGGSRATFDYVLVDASAVR